MLLRSTVRPQTSFLSHPPCHPICKPQIVTPPSIPPSLPPSQELGGKISYCKTCWAHEKRVQRIYEKVFPQCKFSLVTYFRLFIKLKIKSDKPPPSSRSGGCVRGGFWLRAGAALHSTSHLKEEAWPHIVLLAQKDRF